MGNTATEYCHWVIVTNCWKRGYCRLLDDPRTIRGLNKPVTRVMTVRDIDERGGGREIPTFSVSVVNKILNIPINVHSYIKKKKIKSTSDRVVHFYSLFLFFQYAFILSLLIFIPCVISTHLLCAQNRSALQRTKIDTESLQARDRHIWMWKPSRGGERWERSKTGMFAIAIFICASKKRSIE